MTAPYREEAIIACPLCGLQHRLGAEVCDGCRQPLHERPDPGALRMELQRRRRDSVLAALAILGMIALNLFVFGGAGFVFVTAPIGWLYWSIVRARVLNRALVRIASQ